MKPTGALPIRTFLRADLVAIDLQQDGSLEKSYGQNQPQTLLATDDDPFYAGQKPVD